jgi:hypothetical protein
MKIGYKCSMIVYLLFGTVFVPLSSLLPPFYGFFGALILVPRGSPRAPDATETKRRGEDTRRRGSGRGSKGERQWRDGSACEGAWVT